MAGPVHTIEKQHRTFDLRDVANALTALHRRVCETGHRVEISCEDSGTTCVLISKSELDCLERAVEILGDTEAVQALCGEIAMVAARTQSKGIAS